MMREAVAQAATIRRSMPGVYSGGAVAYAGGMSRILVALLFPLIAAVSVSAGEPEELVLNRNDEGVTEFGLVFLPRAKTVAATMSWSGPQLLKGRRLGTLKLAVYSGSARITAWRDYEGAAAGYPGSMGTNQLFSDDEATALIRSLRNAKLVLSLDSAADEKGEFPVTHFVDMGALCRTFPGSFQNAESGRTGCP
jgi:hypothetical protein